MDHAKSYAFHIAQAIRHKRAMKLDTADGEKLAAEPLEEDVEEFEPAESDAAPAEPKAARKERIKAILAR